VAIFEWDLVKLDCGPRPQIEQRLAIIVSFKYFNLVYKNFSLCLKTLKLNYYHIQINVFQL